MQINFWKSTARASFRFDAEGASALAGKGAHKEAVEETVGRYDSRLILDLRFQFLEVVQLARGAVAARHMVDAEEQYHHTYEQEQDYNHLYERM